MSDTVSVRITANAADFSSACQAATQAMTAFTATVAQASSTLAAASSSLNQATPAMQRAAGASKQAAAAFAETGTAAKQAASDMKQATGAGAALSGTMEKVSEAAGHAAHGSSGLTRELIVMGHEAVSGNFSRIPGSLMVLAERMGGLSLATLGWAAAIGVAVYAVYELAAAWVRVNTTVNEAHGAMIAVGTLNRDSDAQTRSMISDLHSKWGLTRSDANALALKIQGVGGAAAAVKPQIEAAAAALQKLNPEDEKIGDKLVEAFNGGTQSAIRFAESMHLIDASMAASLKDGSADSVGTMSRLLDALQARYVASAAASVKAQKDAFDATVANAIAGAGVDGMPAAAAPPEPVPTQEEQRGLPGTQANAPREEDETAVIDKNTEAYHRQQELLTELTLAQEAQARGVFGAADAVAAIEQKLATTHTVAEQQKHEATMAALQADLAAAKDNADARVEIEKRIAGEIANYEPRNVAAVAAAQRQVTAAEQAAADQRLRLQLAELAGKEAAVRGSAGAEIAIENQKLAVLVAAGKSHTLEYQQELNRRTELEHQAAEQAVAARVAALRGQQEAAEGDIAKQIAIQDQIIAVVRAGGAGETAQLAQEIAKREKMRADEARQAATLAVQVLEEQRRTLDQQTKAELAHVQAQREEGDLTVAAAQRQELQILAAHQQASAAILADEATAASGQIALAREVADRQKELAQQTADQIQQANDRAAEESARAWKQTSQQMRQDFASATMQILTRRSTLQAELIKYGDQLVQKGLQWAMQDAMNFIRGEFMKSAAAQTGAAAQATSAATAATTSQAANAAAASSSVEGHAASAAAGAYDAMASIPYVGPALGAAAAAATFAAVMAYGAMFSAAGGWGDVPYDGALTQLHKNEMVLPASYANVIRGMASPANANMVARLPQAGGSGASAAVSAQTGGAGDTHLHYSPTIHAPASASLEQMLRSESGTMRKWLRNEARNGTLKG